MVAAGDGERRRHSGGRRGGVARGWTAAFSFSLAATQRVTGEDRGTLFCANWATSDRTSFAIRPLVFPASVIATHTALWSPATPIAGVGLAPPSGAFSDRMRRLQARASAHQARSSLLSQEGGVARPVAPRVGRQHRRRLQAAGRPGSDHRSGGSLLCRGAPCATGRPSRRGARRLHRQSELPDSTCGFCCR